MVTDALLSGRCRQKTRMVDFDWMVVHELEVLSLRPLETCYWILAGTLQFQTDIVGCPFSPFEAVVCCLSLSFSYLREFRGRNSFKGGRL